MTFFGYRVIMTFQTFTRQHFFLNIPKIEQLFRFPINFICVGVSNNFDFHFVLFTFLQQSLSSKHIFNRARISAHGDLSANCSPSSEYDNGISYSQFVDW